MVDHLVRFQVRLDPREGERVKSWAYAQGKSLSAALAHLVGRGLDFESGHSPAYLARVINSQGELKIDLATGLLVSSIVTVENSFAFSGAGMGEANGMKMSQLIRINTRRL